MPMVIHPRSHAMVGREAGEGLAFLLGGSLRPREGRSAWPGVQWAGDLPWMELCPRTHTLKP